jgi:DNA-binding response OmpR family regulator
MAYSQKPDLILLDAVMPGMDGYQVCAALRANRPARHPVIFVTALTQPEDETRALEAGAVDFISKPFNVAVVARACAASSPSSARPTPCAN